MASLVRPILNQAFAFTAIRQTQQHMLGGDIIVLHALGVAFGGSQDFRRLARQADFQVGALDLWSFIELVAQFFLDGLAFRRILW